MNIALMVQYYRYLRQMTQSDLAKAAGMLQPNIARIEKTGAHVSTATLAKLSVALRVTSSQLLDEGIFLNQDRSPSLTRDELEQIAEAIWNKKRRLPPHMHCIMSAYREVLPEFNKRYVSRRKPYLAWLHLKTRLSTQEIKNIGMRINKARQRRYGT